MNSKQCKNNSQLSLMLDLKASIPELPAAPTVQVGRDNVTVMPSPTDQDSLRSFRERIIQDLLRTRVMVAD